MLVVIKKRLGKGGTSSPAFQENKCAQAAVDFKVVHENGEVYFVTGKTQVDFNILEEFSFVCQRTGMAGLGIAYWMEICAVSLSGGQPHDSHCCGLSQCLLLAQLWL